MSAPRDFSRESWRLKIERAKQHFVELQNEIRRYGDTNPYRVRWESQKNQKTGKWHGVFEIGEPPGEIAVIIGDIVHNVRSALNHLAVALTGNSDTHFPIRDVDPYLNDKTRKRFEGTVAGMSDAAIAAIKRLQPYTNWPGNPSAPSGLRFVYDDRGQKRIYSDQPGTHYLSVLGRLNNRDKHKRLIAIAAGVSNGYILLDERGRTSRLTEFAGGMLDNGASVVESFYPPPSETKVQVKVFAAVEIAVRIGPPEGPALIRDVLRALTEELPAVVFAELEPCIRL